MNAIRLTSRFIRLNEVQIFQSVQQALNEAGLTPLNDVERSQRLQNCRKSVESILLADQSMNRTEDESK